MTLPHCYSLSAETKIYKNPRIGYREPNSTLNNNNNNNNSNRTEMEQTNATETKPAVEEPVEKVAQSEAAPVEQKQEEQVAPQSVEQERCEEKPTEQSDPVAAT